MLLPARLALVGCVQADDADNEAAGLRARLAAAADALALANRLLPPSDPQVFDLHFQAGLSRHRLAQLHLARGQPERAAEELRATAAEMVRGAADLRLSASEGEAAPPCRAAREFAQLALKQLRATTGAARCR